MPSIDVQTKHAKKNDEHFNSTKRNNNIKRGIRAIYYYYWYNTRSSARIMVVLQPF